MPVVIQPRLPVMVLPRQPDRLVDALGVVLLQNIAPGVQLGGPGHLAGLVRQGHGCAQVIAVVVVDGDALLPLLSLLLQFGLHAAEQACDGLDLHGLGAGQQAVHHGCVVDIGRRLATCHAAWC